MSLLNLARHAVSGTPGTSSPITLGAASTGYISADDAGAVDGRIYTYVIREGNKRELCSGLYTASGTTLTRNTIRSTNATHTNPETFTSAAIVAFVVGALDIDAPWYFQPGTANNAPCMGIPGAIFPQNMGVNTDFVQGTAYYTPFLLRRRTKFIGANIVTGGTVAGSQHAQVGIFLWDTANVKPTTRLAYVDQAIAASTAYAADFSSPVWLDPGYYAYAFLLTASGTTGILCTEYSMDGVWNFSVASNTFKRPMLYSVTGASNLPSPNTASVTGVANTSNGALSLTTSSRVMNLFRFQD